MNTIAILHILFFKYVSCKFASVSYFANMIFLLGRNQNTISSGFKAPPSSVSLLDGDIYIYVYIYTHIFSSFVLGISKPFKQHCGRCARNSPVTRLVDSSNRGASSDRVQRTSHASACLGHGLRACRFSSDPLVFQQQIQLLSPPS